MFIYNSISKLTSIKLPQNIITPKCPFLQLLSKLYFCSVGGEADCCDQ